MLFWLIAICMLVFAVLCVLLPLARSPASQARNTSSLTVYKEQLADIESRLKKGRGNREALEQERAEVARRLLKLGQARGAGGALPSHSPSLVKASSLGALLLVPAITFAIYAGIGSPGTPDQPLSARADSKLEDRSIGEMVQMAERHLEKNPDDVRGWQVLANVYGRTNRPSDRARALEQIIRLDGRKPAVLVELAESTVAANSGIVSARAARLLEEALGAEPDNLKAQILMANAAEQEGQFALALARWEKLVPNGPADARWQALASERIAKLRTRLAQETGPQPDASQVAAAQSMPDEDRQAMIASMVDGLAARLADAPDDIDGWERLMRSRMVLRQADKAREAYEVASTHFPDGTDDRKRLDQLALDLGLKNRVKN
ncbi:MAG: c-type cytochrome biogenesis protein CcmI [Pseudomonadota bacterium]